ncbi:MAG TPA: histidinol-phosphate transaminase [Candidatus Baltobacteraceae bacterium]|jgi:histidinol-phosphate aminotransferase|nr:histidinol-phosphate transaminase [Candidatus Baltobacteraceae bacterium]
MSELSRLARPEIVAMKAYSSARSEGSQTDVTTFLDANENPYSPAFDAGAFASNRYPSPQPPELVRLLAECYGVDPLQMLVTRGADEAIDVLIRTFCSAGSDGIVITPPTYGMYETAANVQDAVIHRVPLRREEEFQLNVPGILSLFQDHPNIKLVFVCTPNNPTGGLLRRSDIVELASNLSGRALVVADQAYVEFSPGAELTDEVSRYPNLVVLRTLSKAYALAGERCGVMIAHPEIVGLARKVLAPYPLAASAVATVLRVMAPEGRAQAQRRLQMILDERKRVEDALRASAAVERVWHSDANFVLFETPHARLLLEIMLKNGIRLRDRSAELAVAGAIRCTIGTPEQNTQMLHGLHEYERAVALLSLSK